MPNYIVRIYKSWGARDPERRWVNNYEVSSDGIGPEFLIGAVQDLVDAERVLHFVDVHFLSATISTWTPDSDPYNPLTFTTVDLEGTGLQSYEPSDAFDSNICLAVRFQANTGRNGRRFFRGCLSEGDVEIGGDARFTITTPGGLAPTGARWMAYEAAMQPFLSGGASEALIVLIGSDALPIVRPVVSVVVGGVTINKHNHRYFDRA